MRNIRTLYKALVPKSMTWSVCVKSDAKLAGMLLRAVPLVFGRLTLSHVKVVWGFAKRVSRLHKQMGPRGLAIYLKTCYVLTQHAAGNMKDASPWELGANVSRTRRGVPRILNPQQRRLLLQQDVGTIRLWLTLFGLYRVIDFKGKLKLKTITDPGVNLDPFMVGWKAWVPVFYDKAREFSGQSWKMDLSRDLYVKSIPFIRKASPNSGGWSSVMAIPWDALLIGSIPSIQAALLEWLKRTDSIELVWGLKALWKLFLIPAGFRIDEFYAHPVGSRQWCRKWVPQHQPYTGGNAYPLYYAMRGDPLRWMEIHVDRKQTSRLLWYMEFYWSKPLSLGRLGFKEEPGKIRVFAMVSVLIQAVMQPLHNWIFGQLRHLSTDGTFDQTAPVERLIEGFQRKGEAWVASYDLSAATDRLPIALQKELLIPLIGHEMCELWAYLLVGFPYRLPRSAKSWNLGFDSVIYAVGQPMGALSSWAMLALTHHALIQYAAFQVSGQPGWFDRYAVLGDDVIIADRIVARKYLAIMREIGVDISLAKSLVSNTGSLEFAKRTWVAGRDVTPVSLAEMLVALRSLGALGELVNKNMKYGVIQISSVARFCGFGFRNLARLPVALGLGNRLSGLVAFVCRPGGQFPMPFEAWLLSVHPGGVDGEVIDPNKWTIAKSLWGFAIRHLALRLTRVERLMSRLSTPNILDETIKKKSATAERGDPEKKKFFSDSTLEFFGFDRNREAIESFFAEWVATPYVIKIRKMFTKVDDNLRVLHPDILPTWSTLYELFKQLGDMESEINSLPQEVSWSTREDEEIPPSAKLITLWRRLRKIARREGITSVSMREGCVDPPKAYRRRAGA